MRHLTRRIDELTRRGLGLLDESEVLRSASEHLTSIRGGGQKSAILLLGELGVLLSDMSVRDWVAFAGLSPKKHTSGTSVEQRERTREGEQRTDPPGALHAGARSGPARATGEGVLREAYRGGEEAPRSSGGGALVAVMRKLLHAIYGRAEAQPRLRKGEVRVSRTSTR